MQVLINGDKMPENTYALYAECIILCTNVRLNSTDCAYPVPGCY